MMRSMRNARERVCQSARGFSSVTIPPQRPFASLILPVFLLSRHEQIVLGFSISGKLLPARRSVGDGGFLGCRRCHSRQGGVYLAPLDRRGREVREGNRRPRGGDPEPRKEIDAGRSPSPRPGGDQGAPGGQGAGPPPPLRVVNGGGRGVTFLPPLLRVPPRISATTTGKSRRFVPSCPSPSCRRARWSAS